MGLFADLRKIVNQTIGKENMFHYQTTPANQLNLLYCVFGEVYYSDKFTLITKLFWLWSSTLGFQLLTNSVILFTIFCTASSEELLIMIYIGFVAVLVIVNSLIRPIIAIFQHRTGILNMISMADKISLKMPTEDVKFCEECQAYTKKMVIIVILLIWGSLVPYTLITIVDLIVFYEEEKLKDHMYYVTPLCGIERFGSMSFFLSFSTISVYACAVFYLIISAYSLLPVLWVCVCYNEAQRIIVELNSITAEDVETDVESYKNFESKFREVNRKTVEDIKDLTILIGHFRGYFEAISGILMPTYLYIEIIHALIMVLPNYNFIVRAREFGVLIGTIIEIYVICWVGGKLEDLMEELSAAVYASPWYKATNLRQDVYILLCQTQCQMTPQALGIYPLGLASFMRFCSTINSSVNVLRVYFAKD